MRGKTSSLLEIECLILYVFNILDIMLGRYFYIFNSTALFHNRFIYFGIFIKDEIQYKSKNIYKYEKRCVISKYVLRKCSLRK